MQQNQPSDQQTNKQKQKIYNTKMYENSTKKSHNSQIHKYNFN